MKILQWNVRYHSIFRTLVVLVLVGMVLLSGAILDAQDVKALSKEANNELRLSQKEMFNGKLDESLAHLGKAEKLIEQIRAVDPDFSQLTTLERKYAKQKKDLDRRLPKEKPAETEKEQTQPAAETGNADELKALAKEANKELQTAQREMFNRKFEQSRTHLDKAAELIEQIKAGDPNFAQLQSLEQKYARQEKDLNKRLPKEKHLETDKPASSDSEQAAKLPGGVTSRLKSIDKTLEGGEKAFVKESIASDEWKVQNLEGILQSAKGTMEDIMSRYGDQIPPEHPDVIAREEAMAAFQQKVEAFKKDVADKQAQAAQAQEAQASQSAEWLEKFRPYAKSGYDKEKYLIGGGTVNTDELLHRKKNYQEAKALFSEYEKTDFLNGKTDELEMMAKDLAYNLKGFEEGYQETVEGFANKIGAELERVEAWLDEQEAKVKSEEDRHPVYLHRDVIGGLKNTMFSLEAATTGEDPRFADFNARLGKIEERADGLRKLGVERTVMLPDKFGGAESDAIKAKAVEFLHKKYADAKELRITIINDDWQEERVWEYTDTSKSAVRYRITRSVTTQIAAKRGSEFFLYSIHVAKNQRSDGSWGELYGHVMFIDPILEENVEKK